MFDFLKAEAYYVCDAAEFEKHINSFMVAFREEDLFRFAKEETSQNPCTVLEYVVEKALLPDADLKEVHKYYDDPDYGVYVDHFLQDLCYRGFIPPGKYLIRMA